MISIWVGCSKNPIFCIRQNSVPICAILASSVLYIYALGCMFMHFHYLPQIWKTRFLHHLCTIVTLRVYNGRHECTQPIGVVENNRYCECSHGGWRLCTRLVACVSGRVSCLHEYAEISVISQWFKTTEQEKTEMQEFLPHRVVKDYGMNRKSLRCRAK